MGIVQKYIFDLINGSTSSSNMQVPNMSD